VPPNLWLPEGTIWRVDLPMDGDPVPSGTVRYGEVPEGMTQAWPLDGGAPPLEMGKDYYLYAAADIMYPISRCIFTAGEDPEPTGCASTGAEAGLLPLVIGALALRRRRTR
jgi:MYXO-CTERM domain-containing protein